MRRPRFDPDAAIWYLVAYVASAFGLLPVLIAALAATEGRTLTPLAYLLVNAGVLATSYLLTTALLVRAHPARRLADLVVSFYLLGLAAGSAAAVLQFIGAPGTPATWIATLVAPATFGIVQITGFSPVTFAEPDVGAIIGVLIGFVAGRAFLRMKGRASGAAADTDVVPMRLPSADAGDTINTHT